MTELKLLIVEDDVELITSYRRDIESFNLESDVKINYTQVSDKDQALVALKDKGLNFDAAIVDLKLDSDGKIDEHYSGNDVVREIKLNLRFPVFVITGTPQHIADDLREQNSLFKIKVRGEEDNHLQQIVDIFNTGITNILGKSGQIENYLDKIFWNHLSNSMDVWIEDTTRNPEEKQKSLLRYTLLHIQEYLELSEESNFEDYHPLEIYITPVIKPYAFTGDIAINKETGKKYVILTPSCDLAQAKAKDILLADIESESVGLLFDKINTIKKGRASQEVIDESKNILRALINNSYSNKYHFLPKNQNFDAGLINFQRLSSIKIKEFNTDFTRVASINSNFTKDIVARFSYYYSRQGSPDFNTDEVYRSLF